MVYFYSRAFLSFISALIYFLWGVNSAYADHEIKSNSTDSLLLRMDKSISSKIGVRGLYLSNESESIQNEEFGLYEIDGQFLQAPFRLSHELDTQILGAEATFRIKQKKYFELGTYAGGRFINTNLDSYLDTERFQTQNNEFVIGGGVQFDFILLDFMKLRSSYGVFGNTSAGYNERGIALVVSVFDRVEFFGGASQYRLLANQERSDSSCLSNGAKNFSCDPDDISFKLSGISAGVNVRF